MIKSVATVLFGGVAAAVVYSLMQDVEGMPSWLSVSSALITAFFIGLVS